MVKRRLWRQRLRNRENPKERTRKARTARRLWSLFIAMSMKKLEQRCQENSACKRLLWVIRGFIRIINLVERDGRIPDGEPPVQPEVGGDIRKAPLNPGELSSPELVQDEQVSGSVSAEGIFIVKPAREGDKKPEFRFQSQAGGLISHDH